MPNHRLAQLFALSSLALAGSLAASPAPLQLELLGTYRSGIFDEGGAEISAFDPLSKRLFVVNGAASSLTVLDLTRPSAPTLLAEIPFGTPVNGVSIHRGLVAVAVEAVPKTDPGKVAFFPAGFPAGTLPVFKEVTVGALPDMLTFADNGNFVLVANEGEPASDYSADPEGSVSIIDLRGRLSRLTQAQVRTVSFAAFNAGGPRASEVPAGFRLIGPGATLSQDLEPEYIALSGDNRTAYVTLQEHNGLAIIDVKHGRVEKLVHLGYKDHSLSGNGLDASDRDGKISIAPWPVKGMYQPDAIAAFRNCRHTYLITANEGDVRDWSAFSEERRIGSLALDPVAFPDAAELKKSANLGRLKVTSTLGDADRDGLYEELYSFGGRSFSIWDDEGSLLFDSGDELEQLTAALYPGNFNAGNDDNDFDSRSDDKGPEPEGVAVGEIDGRTYAFLGLERIGGVAVYDLGRPQYPRFVTYVNTRDFAGDPEAGTAGDLGPEGLTFIARKDSPSKRPLLIVTNEVSGSVGIFEIR